MPRNWMGRGKAAASEKGSAEAKYTLQSEKRNVEFNEDRPRQRRTIRIVCPLGTVVWLLAHDGLRSC